MTRYWATYCPLWENDLFSPEGNITGADSSNKGCFGRKTNLCRESEDFAGNRETWQVSREIWDIFRTMSKDLILHVIKQYICTVICTMCMHCILCILMTLDMKRPISNVSNWSSMKLECNYCMQSPADWHNDRTSARHILSAYLAESDIQNNFKNGTKYKIKPLRF